MLWVILVGRGVCREVGAAWGAYRAGAARTRPAAAGAPPQPIAFVRQAAQSPRGCVNTPGLHWHTGSTQKQAAKQVGPSPRARGTKLPCPVASEHAPSSPSPYARQGMGTRAHHSYYIAKRTQCSRERGGEWSGSASSGQRSEGGRAPGTRDQVPRPTTHRHACAKSTDSSNTSRSVLEPSDAEAPSLADVPGATWTRNTVSRPVHAAENTTAQDPPVCTVQAPKPTPHNINIRLQAESAGIYVLGRGRATQPPPK